MLRRFWLGYGWLTMTVVLGAVMTTGLQLTSLTTLYASVNYVASLVFVVWLFISSVSGMVLFYRLFVSLD